MKPHLLDLFCGAGGCSAGYAEYFDVTGVDIVPQPRYPFRFIQADALTFPLDGFDAYHASPLCQGFTQMLNWNEQIKDKHPNYIGIMRERFLETKKPYVIENVEGARKFLIDPLLLCGNMFGLRVYRHRLFEISSTVFVFRHTHIKHKAKIVHAGMAPRDNEFYCPVGHLADQEGSQRAMGINWMCGQKEIAQAIPPAYTAWIAPFLLAAVQANQEVPA